MAHPISSLNIKLRKYGDIVLAVLITAIVAMMIVPLPTPLLDILITINLTLAVTILLISLYVSEALAIATFPTILLITTLYRLGLNVSSTRLILLQGYAGEVIQSFGNFVVRGNYIVGGVIFLILTLIQFIVIAKGSERVAEVAARFTLDALPGKQMSIDADLRAGIIDQQEARRRRQLLQRESQFYGAMDGAMKFVKGDAIAGIIITAINIIGGVIIGITQRGLTGVEALQLYGLLTIGDGLVSQIPALVISTAAGMVVTRVASEEETHLGSDIGRQLLSHPKALLIVSVLLVLLGIIPGLPTVPFLIIAVFVGVLGFVLRRREARKGEEKKVEEKSGTGEEGYVPTVTPILVEMGEALSTLLKDERNYNFKKSLLELKQMIFYDTGIPVPPIRVRIDPLMDANSFKVSIDEIPVYWDRCYLDKVFCIGDINQLYMTGIRVDPSYRTRINGKEGVWIDSTQESILLEVGLECLKGDQFLLRVLEYVIKKNGSQLLGIQEVQDLVSSLENIAPALVHQAMPKPLSLKLLKEVLQRLVDEGVSIRNLRNIFEALLEWVPHTTDPVELTELVRSSLKKQITYQYTKGGNSLNVFLLSPEVEEIIRNSIHKTEVGSFLTLDPQSTKLIIDVAKATIGNTPNPIILTHPDIRRFVKKLLEVEVPEVTVLSYQEIMHTIIIQPVGKISLNISR